MCLIGIKNGSQYFVELEATESFSESSVASKAGQFSSELLQGKNYSYHGYRVLFDKKIILKKNTMYDIRAKISGPPSLRGLGGHSLVQCSGVTFKFINSVYSKNGTDTCEGQFPEFLFSV